MSKVPIGNIKGKSAFQQAVQGGYAGTEADFNTLLAQAVSETIEFAEVVDGDLIVTKLDGSTSNLGRVQGADGSNVIPTNEAIAQPVTEEGPAKDALSNTFAGRELPSFNDGVATPRAPFHNRSTLTPDLSGSDDFVGHVLSARIEGDFTDVPSTNSGWVFGTNLYTNTAPGPDDGAGLDWIMNLSEVSICGGGFTGAAIGLMAEAAFLGQGAGGHAGTMMSMKVGAPKRKDGATGGTAERVYGLWIDEVPDTGDYLGSSEAYSLFVAGGLSYFTGRAIFGNNVSVQGELRANVITSRSDTTRRIIWGSGSPEGVVTAGVGSVYFNTIAGSPGYVEWVKESGTGNTGWRNRGIISGALAATFGSTAAFANTNGKYAGRQAFETTNNRPIWATGSTAASSWVYADGTTAVTPG